MINLNEFTQKFAQQFDETPLEIFTPETKFKEIEEWSSMLALVIIAMVDEEMNVKLSGDDIRNSNTIQDIYTRIIK